MDTHRSVALLVHVCPRVCGVRTAGAFFISLKVPPSGAQIKGVKHVNVYVYLLKPVYAAFQKKISLEINSCDMNTDAMLKDAKTEIT